MQNNTINAERIAAALNRVLFFCSSWISESKWDAAIAEMWPHLLGVGAILEKFRSEHPELRVRRGRDRAILAAANRSCDALWDWLPTRLHQAPGKIDVKRIAGALSDLVFTESTRIPASQRNGLEILPHFLAAASVLAKFASEHESRLDGLRAWSNYRDRARAWDELRDSLQEREQSSWWRRAGLPSVPGSGKPSSV
jgi:hypothetical protein